MNYSTRIRLAYVRGWIRLYWWEVVKLLIVAGFGALVMTLLTGCGTTPYIEGGIHHVATDLNTHNPAGIIRVGVEKDLEYTRYDCGWTHFSMVTEGYPFNSRDEPYFDSFGCSVRLLLR